MARATRNTDHPWSRLRYQHRSTDNSHTHLPNRKHPIPACTDAQLPAVCAVRRLASVRQHGGGVAERRQRDRVAVEARIDRDDQRAAAAIHAADSRARCVQHHERRIGREVGFGHAQVDEPFDVVPQRVAIGALRGNRRAIARAGRSADTAWRSGSSRIPRAASRPIASACASRCARSPLPCSSGPARTACRSRRRNR